MIRLKHADTVLTTTIRYLHFKPDSHRLAYLIGHYNLDPHTIHVVCVNFSGRTQNIMSFHRIILDSKRFYQKSAERKSPIKIFFNFSFYSRYSSWGMLERGLSHYPLNLNDFRCVQKLYCFYEYYSKKKKKNIERVNRKVISLGVSQNSKMA